MTDKEIARYQAENRKRRKMLMRYGSKFYSLPHTYKRRNRAYKKAFGIENPAFIGNNVTIVREHRQWGDLRIGEQVVLSDNVVIDYTGRVEIGSYVHISSGVKIYSHNHDCYQITHGVSTPIVETTKIGDHGWIGANAIILSGVTIGDGCVIGAGSIVTHDIPDYSVAVGNPAKVIRHIEEGHSFNEHD